MTRIGAVLGLAILGIACQTPGPPFPTVAAARLDGLEAGIVTRVLDGDSALMEIEGAMVEIRLFGINAPEQDECHHEEATGHLEGAIGNETVTVDRQGIDQFDRVLVHLWSDDVLVNLDLVSGGFAIATSPGQGDIHGEALISAESSAYDDRRGLWSETACGAMGPLPVVTVDVPGSRFDPPGPDEEQLGEERVSFRGVEGLDLDGWRIRDESSAHRCRLAPGTTITAAGSITVTSADACWDPGTGAVWNNDGDLVLLLDGSGRVVSRHRYQS